MALDVHSQTKTTDRTPVQAEPTELSRRSGHEAHLRWRQRPAVRGVVRRWQLYAMLVLPVVYLAIFNYWPMLGIQIAFRSYNPAGGMWGSPWVGLANFETFGTSYQFWPIIKNTLLLHFYSLLATFPLPIVLALALNYVRRRWYSRVVQMITYAPHFIPTVVVVGILFAMLDPHTGIYVVALHKLGLPVPDFLSNPAWFRHVYVWSGAWQTMGFSAIIYLAALAGINPELHEAATVDGASRIRRVWHIDLPGIAPVAVILLILSMGSTLSTGFEKVLLMQNQLNLGSSQVIDTYVYQVGLGSQIPQFSYGAAIGVFQSVVGLILIVGANRLARRATESGLW